MRKVLFIMTLLMTMLSQGAWAQSTTTRTVTTAEGSGGTDWTIPTSADEGQPVTVTYTGQHRVKSVRVRGIAKLTCDNTDVSFSGSEGVNSTKTKVNVSAFGGTNINVVSSDESKCTVSYSEGTITITRQTISAFDDVQITVSVTPSDNFVWKTANNVTFNVLGVAAGPKAAKDATAEDLGKVIGADGYIYADADAATAASTTAVAMIAYLGNGSDCAHGLAIQLNASPESKDWNDAKTYASGLTAVPGGTWRLPSKADWQNMFVGCAKSGDAGASDSMNPIAGFKEKIGATGITCQSGDYWSSTDSGSNAYLVLLNLSGSDARANFFLDATSNPCSVLGCLAF